MKALLVIQVIQSVWMVPVHVHRRIVEALAVI